MTNSSGERGTAGFGWEVTDLHNNRVTAVHEIERAIVIDSMYLDAATMITKPPSRAGFCEVLITIDLRDHPPEFTGAHNDQPPPVHKNAEIAAGRIHNPNNLRIVSGTDVSHGAISRMILKSWVPETGVGSSAGRNGLTQPNITARPGQRIMIVIGHAGVQCDAEIQAVMAYRLL